MREIKFRAFDTTSKEMYDIGQLDIPWNYPEIKIMQFTGLHDKNGKEIYEGDIVRHPDWIPGENLIVKWSNEQGCWALNDWAFLETTISDAEIIGSIYDNP